MYTGYAYEWEPDVVYVGCTSLPLDRRTQNHRDGTLSRVGHRLFASHGEPSRIRVLFQVEEEEEADTLEIAHRDAYRDAGWDVRGHANRRSTNAKNLARVHDARDDQGRSLHAVAHMEKFGARMRALHAEKDEDGKSVHARKCGLAAHREKDEDGKSVLAVRAGQAAHREKDEDGKSVLAVRAGQKGAAVIHAEKDDQGRSVHAVRTLVVLLEEKDEDGKSVHARKCGFASHQEKDEDGKSVHARKMSLAAHREKDEDGRSVNAIRAGALGGSATFAEKDENGKSVAAAERGRKTTSQTWECNDCPYTGNPMAVANHLKRERHSGRSKLD